MPKRAEFLWTHMPTLHRVPYSRIKIGFVIANGAVLMIDAAYGATIIEQAASSVTVELGVMPASSNEMQLMGSGSDLTRLDIDCIGIEGPPPSPPHPLNCDLYPHFKERACLLEYANALMARHLCARRDGCRQL